MAEIAVTVQASGVSMTEVPCRRPSRPSFLGGSALRWRLAELERADKRIRARRRSASMLADGTGDSFSLPYFAVSDVADALEQVEALGGSVVHPGEAWAICKDSEGSPFGLARQGVGDRSRSFGGPPR
jgi:hypothetical protein